jgi:UDP-N-acetylmuramoyl-tripeptide--D-alanyl-D-alanine ligase
MNLSLLEIINMVDGSRYVSEGSPSKEWIHLRVSSASTDSRSISEGELFVPISGETFDGHDFVEQVASRGAAASLWRIDRKPYPDYLPIILVDDPLLALQRLAKRYRESLPLKVVAVTGSNGKTTTKDLISSVLSTTYKVHKTQGNFNTHIGLPLTLLQMDVDTEIAVLEMGMRGLGEIALLSDIAQPDLCVITNIGEAHLERLGNRENIAQAKLEVIAGMHSDGILIYPGDEPLLKKNYPYSTITFGKGQDNDLALDRINWNDNLSLSFTVKPGYTEFRFRWVGEHNVINALAAIAVARQLGVTDEQIALGLAEAEIAGMRIEIITGYQGMTIVNDAYNASPTSVKAAIQLLQEMPGFETKIAVLGDMLELGEQEITFHKEIGSFIDPEQVDYVIATGLLGRSMIDGARQHFPEDRAVWMETKGELIEWIRSVASPTTVTLIKASRGMKLEEIIAGLQNKE